MNHRIVPATLDLTRVRARRVPALPVASWRRIVTACIVIGVVGLGAFFTHEIFHALVARVFGARILEINALGIQLHPALAWKPDFGFGGYVLWLAPPSVYNHRLILMAGSMGNLFVALSAVTFLTFDRSGNLRRLMLAGFSLYCLDSFIHITPILGVTLPGWNSRFVRTFAESYFAAVNFGVPGNLYVGLILLITAAILMLTLRGLLCPRSKP